MAFGYPDEPQVCPTIRVLACLILKKNRYTFVNSI